VSHWRDYSLVLLAMFWILFTDIIHTMITRSNHLVNHEKNEGEPINVHANKDEHTTSQTPWSIDTVLVNAWIAASKFKWSPSIFKIAKLRAIHISVHALWNACWNAVYGLPIIVKLMYTKIATNSNKKITYKIVIITKPPKIYNLK